MPNVFDYLKWRGDLCFNQDGFNEVDSLIFACLVYIDFEGIVPKETCQTSITIKSAADLIQKTKHFDLKNPFLNRFPELLDRVAESNRFKDVCLRCFVNVVDYEKPNQFSAIVFSFDNRAHYIAFRGTDDNLAGWKEDFLMSFKDVVLAQQQAVRYINTVIPKLRGHIYIGGHSKGGNLAVFAAAHTPDKNKRRIVAVYNNDGPGFHTSIIKSDGYQKIVGRIQTIIPKSSVVGMLLEHGEDYKIVACSENLIMSHNPLKWEVTGTSFIHEHALSKTSLQVNDALRSWLSSLSLEQRRQFVEALFDIIHASGAQTLTDISKERLAVIDAMIKKLKTMDKQTRTLLKDTIMAFFSIRQRLLKESISQGFEALLAKKV